MTAKQLAALLEKAEGHCIETTGLTTARCTHKNCDFTAHLFDEQWIVLDGNVDTPEKERLVQLAEDNFATRFFGETLKEHLKKALYHPPCDDDGHPPCCTGERVTPPLCGMLPELPELPLVNRSRWEEGHSEPDAEPLVKGCPCCKDWAYPELCCSLKHSPV